VLLLTNHESNILFRLSVLSAGACPDPVGVANRILLATRLPRARFAKGHSSLALLLQRRKIELYWKWRAGRVIAGPQL